MALVTTVAGSSSDSYLSVAEADALIASVGLKSWAARLTADKEAALRQATIDIDSHRFHNGERYSGTQALKFPRAVDGAVIIEAVRKACAYQADWQARAGESDLRAQGKAKTVDRAGSPMCQRAWPVLRPYVATAGSFKQYEV